MDTIEISNLNRQFLFRKEHVGQYKAAVAGAQVAKMNPNIKTDTLQYMVAPSTQGTYLPSLLSLYVSLQLHTGIGTFDRAFWCQQDIICNALDNLKARLYVDNRCVQFK